jgi:hypothetical protein
MSAYAEPPNGDFVAYIEELQRESAARILAQSKQAMVELPSGRTPRVGGAGSAATTRLDSRQLSPGTGDHGFADAAHPEQETSSILPLSRVEADKLLARLASDRATAQQVGSGIALIIGVLLILYWFASRAVIVPLLLGLVLVVWSIRKLRRTAARRADVRASAGRAVISKVFGQIPPNA